MKRRGHSVEKISDLKGLGKTDPWFAFLLFFFLMSMAGIPPFAGFIGKLYVFRAAIEAQLYTLSVVGVLTSVISTFYYLWVIKQVYFDQPEDSFDARPASLSFVAGVGALATLGFLFIASPVVNAAEAAAKVLFG
jgi:NADH-quinone oxidoreductase subunit N